MPEKSCSQILIVSPLLISHLDPWWMILSTALSSLKTLEPLPRFKASASISERLAYFLQIKFTQTLCSLFSKRYLSFLNRAGFRSFILGILSPPNFLMLVTFSHLTGCSLLLTTVEPHRKSLMILSNSCNSWESMHSTIGWGRVFL